MPDDLELCGGAIAEPSPERYRGFPDAPHYWLGENQELVDRPLTGVARTVHSAALRLVHGSPSLATLVEHTRQLCAELRIPAVQAPRVEEELAALAASGLLVSQSRLMDHLRRTPAADPVRITTVGIPTRDRAAMLERCLASLIAGMHRGEQSPDLIVVDDSTQEEQRAANRGLLASLRDVYPGRLLYAGPGEKERFAQTLARHAGLDAEADAVAFALTNAEGFPIATGASRNLLLLHAAGEAQLQLDDDVVCRLAPAPDARPGLVCTSQHDPTEFWFREDEEPLAGPFTPHDLLSVHEQLLGKGLGDCLATLPVGEWPDFDRAGAGFFRNADGRVRVTTAGVAGDAGMSSSLYFLLLEGRSRERLSRSEAVYRAGIGRHRVVRAVTRPTIAHGAVCQAMNLGLDHRRTLPPFLPVQRNQDGVFAALIKACCDDTYSGFLPWLVVHQPPRSRVLTDGDLVGAVCATRSDQIVQLLIRASAPGGAGTFEGKLRAMGETLEGLSVLSERDFTEALRHVVWEQMGGLGCQLSELLRKHNGQSAWWAADARRVLNALRGRLAEPDYIVPDDLRRAFGADAALPALRRLLGRFGRLLRCWPVLVEAARDLRASGVRPAEPV